MQVDSISFIELFIRLFVGILFIFQGYDKLFRLKIKGVVRAFQSEAAVYQVPHWLLNILAYYTSLVEFFGGLFLVLGIFTQYSLLALGLDILLVSLAFSIVEPMWDTKHVFPRIILLSILLALNDNYCMYCLEKLF